jgi:hypothetical protein
VDGQINFARQERPFQFRRKETFAANFGQWLIQCLGLVTLGDKRL